MRHKLTNAIHSLMRTLAEPFDPYRPELHYMRGPGPKCQAKRAGPAPSTPASTQALPALREIAEAHA